MLYALSDFLIMVFSWLVKHLGHILFLSGIEKNHVQHYRFVSDIFIRMNSNGFNIEKSLDLELTSRRMLLSGRNAGTRLT